MKKRTLITIVLACVNFHLVSLQAQSIDKASASYQKFNMLRVKGADEISVYNALYQCYKDYVEVLATSTPNSSEYSQAKGVLREMYPFLQNAAAYNSSRGNQQNALIFAQAFMDT